MASRAGALRCGIVRDEAQLQRLRELAEARNEAEAAAYAAEKQIKDLGDQLEDADKEDIEKLAADVREATKGEDVAAIKAALETLQSRQHTISEALYAKAQAAAAEGAATGDAEGAPVGGPASDDEVVDAEIVDEGK